MALVRYAKNVTPPPCEVCGMPSNLMDTKAHKGRHLHVERNQRNAQPSREKSAEEWLAAHPYPEPTPPERVTRWP